MAERFKSPSLPFIDTMGAYPGVGAEERGQAEAIATSLHVCPSLKVLFQPYLVKVVRWCTLGIGVADRVVMLSHSIYSSFHLKAVRLLENS